MTPHPGEKKTGNGMRLSGPSFPSEGPFLFFLLEVFSIPLFLFVALASCALIK